MPRKRGPEFSIDRKTHRCNRLPRNNREWTQWVHYLVDEGALDHAKACIAKISNEAVRSNLYDLVQGKKDQRKKGK